MNDKVEVDYCSSNEILFSSSNTVVSKATRKKDGKEVLIKKPANPFPSVRLVESFKKDFHTTQSLHEKCPRHFINMIEMLEQENGSVFLVEEQEGDSLSNFLKCKKSLGVKKFLKLSISMSKALSECHSLQICHRDIKLANFILGCEDEVKLIDFGLSVIFSNKAPSIACSSPTGTYSYMSYGRDKELQLLSDIIQSDSLETRMCLISGYSEWVYAFKKKIDIELIQIGGVKGIEKIKQCNDEEMGAFSILLTESLDTLYVSGKTNPLMPVTVSLMSLYLHLTQGLTENAPVSFSFAGWMISSFFQDPVGYELTNLAEKLLEQTKNPNFNEALVRFTLGVNQIFGGTLKQGLYHFNAGCNYAIAHGEYVFGCYNMNNWGMRSTTNGDNYPNVISKLEGYQAFCKKIGNLFVHDLLECQLNFAQDLVGIRKYKPKFLLEGVREANWSGTFFYFMEAMVAYHNGDFEKAKNLLDEREPRLAETQGFCGYYCAQFFHALCYSHFYNKTKDEALLNKFDSFVELFKSYSALSPHYFGPRYQLLLAVRESFKENADTLSVLNFFNQALESAQRFGLPLISAVTNELMLDYCIEKNILPSICQYYFEKLILIWDSIGGMAKISKLNKKYSKFNYFSSKKHISSSSDLTVSSSSNSSS
eukprot:gene9924-2245_t